MSEEKFDRLRGRHKKRASKETRQWEQRERERAPAPPPCWMNEETAQKLLELRKQVDPWA